MKWADRRPHNDQIVNMFQASKSKIEDKVNFYDLSEIRLKELLLQMGHKPFRAQQLFQWVYKYRVTDFDKMTNVAKLARQEFKQKFYFSVPALLREFQSRDGTQKFLFSVGPGLSIESVLIPNKDRLTLCVSSEVGCNMACRFCYTGKQNLRHRLTTSEILGQFLYVHDQLSAKNLKLRNVVFMGMGEPLDNPKAVFDSIDIFNSTWGINFSRRKITVSTSGLVPQMPLITQSGVRLAVSLNGVDDEVRSRLMPINRQYPLTDLLEACLAHTQQTKDKVTFEYILIDGVTDSLAAAHKLLSLTKGIPCKINLIPFNEHVGSEFKRPSPQRVIQFQNELIKLGSHVLLRRTMGRDIYAACGQLTSFSEGRPETLSI